MAYTLFIGDAVDEEQGFFLCSTPIWTLFSGWVNQLKNSYASLRAFVADGEVLDTEALGKELLDAQAIEPSQTPGVQAILATLIDLIGVGDISEYAYVSQD